MGKPKSQKELNKKNEQKKKKQQQKKAAEQKNAEKQRREQQKQAEQRIIDAANRQRNKNAAQAAVLAVEVSQEEGDFAAFAANARAVLETSEGTWDEYKRLGIATCKYAINVFSHRVRQLECLKELMEQAGRLAAYNAESMNMMKQRQNVFIGLPEQLLEDVRTRINDTDDREKRKRFDCESRYEQLKDRIKNIKGTSCGDRNFFWGPDSGNIESVKEMQRCFEREPFRIAKDMVKMMVKETYLMGVAINSTLEERKNVAGDILAEIGLLADLGQIKQRYKFVGVDIDNEISTEQQQHGRLPQQPPQPQELREILNGLVHLLDRREVLPLPNGVFRVRAQEQMPEDQNVQTVLGRLAGMLGAYRNDENDSEHERDRKQEFCNDLERIANMFGVEREFAQIVNAPVARREQEVNWPDPGLLNQLDEYWNTNLGNMQNEGSETSDSGQQPWQQNLYRENYLYRENGLYRDNDYDPYQENDYDPYQENDYDLYQEQYDLYQENGYFRQQFTGQTQNYENYWHRPELQGEPRQEDRAPIDWSDLYSQNAGNTGRRIWQAQQGDLNDVENSADMLKIK